MSTCYLCYSSLQEPAQSVCPVCGANLLQPNKESILRRRSCYIAKAGEPRFFGTAVATNSRILLVSKRPNAERPAVIIPWKEVLQVKADPSGQRLCIISAENPCYQLNFNTSQKYHQIIPSFLYNESDPLPVCDESSKDNCLHCKAQKPNQEHLLHAAHCRYTEVGKVGGFDTRGMSFMTNKRILLVPDKPSYRKKIALLWALALNMFGISIYYIFCRYRDSKSEAISFGRHTIVSAQQQSGHISLTTKNNSYSIAFTSGIDEWHGILPPSLLLVSEDIQ